MGMKPRLAGPASLPEVHGSVHTAWPTAFRRMFAFAGPAYLVSVGYMDPGNWATDLEGGARFGYQLLWVLVLSNAMAILLQTLSARLGIVSGRDLAQACREAYPPAVSYSLWFLCEIAIAACDLAEVLGAAIGLNLLFHIPLTAGVLLTALDTILVLWLTRYGIRLVEAIILSLVLIVTGCFLVELWFAKPLFDDVASGLVPRLNDASLYIAIGMLGATVMPHNLYLHSALVQTRRIGKTAPEKKIACRYNFIDSFIALNGALIVNAAILVMAAAVFFRSGTVVTEIQQAHQLLAPLLGTALASGLFAIALLASGQSSTLTGTYAGQIVMEGFLNLRVRPWLRRLITRSVAIIPAVITVSTSGDQGTYRLLILSQVILSMQLPFAIIPLVRFTSDRSRMGEFANRTWVTVLAWSTAVLIIVLNFRLAGDAIVPWVSQAPWRAAFIVPIVLGIVVLLGWVTFARPRPQAVRGPPSGCRRGHRSSGPQVPFHPGSAGSFRSRSGRGRPRRRYGAPAWRNHSLAARRRGSHQPVVRTPRVHGRSLLRSAIPGRHRQFAQIHRPGSRPQDRPRAQPAIGDHTRGPRTSARPGGDGSARPHRLERSDFRNHD